MDSKNHHLRDMLMHCYDRAVDVALEFTLADDDELDDVTAVQSLRESYPLVEKLSSPGIRQWIMGDLTKRGFDGEIRYLLNQASSDMERGSPIQKYDSAKFILAFISREYELQGFKFD